MKKWFKRDDDALRATVAKARERLDHTVHPPGTWEVRVPILQPLEIKAASDVARASDAVPYWVARFRRLTPQGRFVFDGWEGE